METIARSGPELSVEPGAVRPGSARREWLVAWRLRNSGLAPVQVLSAHQPHDHFFHPEQELAPPLVLAPGQAAELALPVAFEEAPGAEVENAFLILRLLWDGRPWRVLLRLRVAAGADGTPRPTAERLTTQPVGFAR